MFFVLMVLICQTALGCAEETKITPKLLPMSTGGDISYGLYQMDGEIEIDTHFQITSQTALKRIFSFGNLIEYEREYKLLVFANYEQISFTVDDNKANLYHDFMAMPYEHIQFTITLPKLEDGYYDLLFVIVKDPNNISLDEEYRKQTDMSHLITMRYSLQVGEKNKANEEIDKIVYDTSFDIVEDESLDGVFLNRETPRLKRLLTLDCAMLEKPQLFIHMGNQSDITKNYAVILLYDWQQIQIKSLDVVYLAVPPKSRASFPFLLGIEQKEKGVHNLTAICVESPFQIATIHSPRADFSIRIGINVKDN